MAFGLIAALLVVPSPARASDEVVIPIDDNFFSSIQAAIDAASPGDVISIGEGTATLTKTQVITIPAAKLGITIRGAGVDKTVIQKSAGTINEPVIFVGPSTGPGASTTLEQFTLRNVGSKEVYTSTLAAQAGIAIRASGSPGAPSVVRNVAFLDFVDNGLQIFESNHADWIFEKNTFDGTRIGIWINSNHRVTIRDSRFRNCQLCVGMDAVDTPRDLSITGNSFEGGANAYASGPSGIGFQYRSLALTGAAPTDPATRNWSVTNNLITGLGTGVRFRNSGNGTDDLSDIEFRLNAIFDNTLVNRDSMWITSSIRNETSKDIVVNDNWWGQSTGPLQGQLYEESGKIAAGRWIASFVSDADKVGQPGFWPTRISNALTPLPAGQPHDVTLTSVPASPSLAIPASSTPVEVTVTEVLPADIPAGAPFELSGAVLLDIEISGSFAAGAAITVCVTGEAPSRLWHYPSSGNGWVDITDDDVSVGGKICGQVADFSPFALAPQKAPAPVVAPLVEPLLPVVLPGVTVADNTATCTVGEYSRSVTAVDVSLLLDDVVLETRSLAAGVTSTSWPIEVSWAGETLNCRVFARGDNVVSTATSPALALPGAAAPPPGRDIPKEPLRFFQTVSFNPNGSRLSADAREQVKALATQGGPQVRYRVVGFKTLTEWWRGAKVARPRAEAVAGALVAAGVPREQILIRYGGISDLGGVAGRVVRISTLP